MLLYFYYGNIKIRIKVNSLKQQKELTSDELSNIVDSEIIRKSKYIKNIGTYLEDSKGVSTVFIIGKGEKSKIYISEFFLRLFSKKELESVILHEEYHIKNYNYIKAKTLYFILVSIIFYILLNGIESKILFFIFIINSHIIVKLLINCYLRSCEYRADKYSAELTGERTYIIKALKKIEKICNSEKQSLLKNAIAQHPSIKKRIYRLQRSSYVKKWSVD